MLVRNSLKLDRLKFGRHRGIPFPQHPLWSGRFAIRTTVAACDLDGGDFAFRRSCISESEMNTGFHGRAESSKSFGECWYLGLGIGAATVDGGPHRFGSQVM